MSTLKDLATHAAEHHLAMSKLYGSSAAALRQPIEGEADTSTRIAVAKLFNDVSHRHVQDAEHAVELARSCSGDELAPVGDDAANANLKAAGLGFAVDRSNLRPDFVSVVPPGLRAVPRHGQRDISSIDPIDAVPREFQKLVTVEED
jgi:hypothetical protein